MGKEKLLRDGEVGKYTRSETGKITIKLSITNYLKRNNHTIHVILCISLHKLFKQIFLICDDKVPSMSQIHRMKTPIPDMRGLPFNYWSCLAKNITDCCPWLSPRGVRKFPIAEDNVAFRNSAQRLLRCNCPE